MGVASDRVCGYDSSNCLQSIDDAWCQHLGGLALPINLKHRTIELIFGGADVWIRLKARLPDFS